MDIKEKVLLIEQSYIKKVIAAIECDKISANYYFSYKKKVIYIDVDINAKNSDSNSQKLFLKAKDYLVKNESFTFLMKGVNTVTYYRYIDDIISDMRVRGLKELITQIDENNHRRIY